VTADPTNRYGKFVVVWTEDGRPLDRWERDVDQVREHAAFVRGLADELRALSGRCDEVLLGRETGAKFWSRFDANVDALERVAERDNLYAQELERLAAREAERRL
jgi:hypothetical protein